VSTVQLEWSLDGDGCCDLIVLDESRSDRDQEFRREPPTGIETSIISLEGSSMRA
jgi:hypothetical protein